MATRKSLPCLLALLGSALTLAACGGGDGTTTHPEESIPAAKAKRLQREVGTDSQLTRGDCLALQKRLARLRDDRPSLSAETSPPQSHCSLTAPGTDVNVYLDASRSAHQRYENRIVEQVQFGTPDPRKLPQAVPGVGEPSPYSHSANWVPALHTLFAVRGPRWVTVSYSVPALGDSAAREGAAVLARLAFELSRE